MPIRDELELTAYHEAGHFVASYVLFPYRHRTAVSIDASDNTGTCFDDEPWDGATADDWHAHAVTVLAGFAAEVERDPSCAGRAALTASSDFERAEKAMTSARERCMGRAVELVREHWNKIELVAQALLDWKSDGTGALEVLCELADAPEGYADAVRALALMGKLPRSGDVVSVPPWLAAARYPRGEMEPKKHRALARTGGRVATVKELLGLSDEEAAAVEKRLEAEQDGQDNDAAPDAKRER